MSLTHQDFDYVRRLVHRSAGIVLDSGKAYLVQSRLHALLRTGAWKTIKALIDAARQSSVLQALVVDAMTTNETSFFRDGHPFDALRDQVLPERITARADVRRLHMWSAACSSGQEIYSLAMLLDESFPALGRWDVRLVATDISDPMVARTAEGRYSALEVGRGLSAERVRRFFRPVDGGYQVSDRLRARVTCARVNLLDGWGFHQPFDLVMLRNVLIYFDDATRADVLRRLCHQLHPGGYLLLGSTESVPSGLPLRRITRGRTVLYQRT